MSNSLGHGRRALVAVMTTPFLLLSAGAASQAVGAPAEPKAVTATAARPKSPAFSCESLKNWLDHHNANTAQWRKVSVMWMEKCLS